MGRPRRQEHHDRHRATVARPHPAAASAGVRAAVVERPRGRQCHRWSRPSAAHVERQLVVEAIDERRAVRLRKDTKPIVRSCGWPSGNACARADELAPQGLVAPLGGVDDLVVQRLQVVLHPAERGLRRAASVGSIAGIASMRRAIPVDRPDTPGKPSSTAWESASRAGR